MRIYSDESLRNFDFWSGARANAEELTYDQLDDLEVILEDIYPEGMSATELNDLMWFEFDTIKEWLGIEDEDDEDEDFEESLRRNRMSAIRRRNESLRRTNNRQKKESMRRKSNRRR